MQNNQPKHLAESELKPFLSTYLMSGFREDSFTFKEVSFHDEGIEATILMDKYFVSSDTGEFHLTVPTAMLCIFQLAIIFSCKDRSVKQKSGEFYLRDIEIKCRKEITTTLFKIKLIITNKRVIGSNNVLYQGTISINDNSFFGKASFIMPS